MYIIVGDRCDFLNKPWESRLFFRLTQSRFSDYLVNSFYCSLRPRIVHDVMSGARNHVGYPLQSVCV